MSSLTQRRAHVESLRPWVEMDVVSEADAAVAAALADICGESSPSVLLAVALAVGAPRSGHTAVNLELVKDHAVSRVERSEPDAVEAVLALPWPTDASDWRESIEQSPLVTADHAPIVVDHGLVYLRRFHTAEVRVADQIASLAANECEVPPTDLVSSVLGLSDSQRQAVERCCSARLGVLTGAPGTGKTRTVAAILAALLAVKPDLVIGAAAPTGKAAARMAGSLSESVSYLAASGESSIESAAIAIGAIQPTTVHRLLGVRRGSDEFWHHSGNTLPHDVVVIDEASMLSLSLIDSLLDAMRPGSRIILVGDAMQLASVDAGSVLGDIAGAPGVVGMRVAELTETHRFDADSQIGRFAAAILAHDVELAQTVLGELDAQQRSLDEQIANEPMLQITADLSVMSNLLIQHGMSLVEHARHDPTDAVNQLDAMRVLCAHRTGPFGVSYWNQYTQRLLSDAGAHVGHHDVGRPVMVTANDPTSGLFNGDVGVVVATPGGSRIAFPGADQPSLAPTTLEHLETVYAMTIHKSQGSEFDHVVVVLPPAQSRLATRELLYTAVTRAKRRVTLIGTIESVIAAMNRTSLRMSALRQRLV